jgi:hypothetical protein
MSGRRSGCTGAWRARPYGLCGAHLRIPAQTVSLHLPCRRKQGAFTGEEIPLSHGTQQGQGWAPCPTQDKRFPAAQKPCATSMSAAKTQKSIVMHTRPAVCPSLHRGKSDPCQTPDRCCYSCFRKKHHDHLAWAPPHRRPQRKEAQSRLVEGWSSVPSMSIWSTY